MTKKERLDKLNQVCELSATIKDILYGIVWENQEGQEDHFDRLTKSEQVALIGLLNNAVNLNQSTTSYKNWFIDG